MSLFFGVLGLAISELAILPWPWWARIVASFVTTAIGIIVVSAVAPRVNNLVQFLTKPHGVSEFGRAMRDAWRSRSRIRNWRLVRMLEVAIFGLLIAGWIWLLLRDPPVDPNIPPSIQLSEAAAELAETDPDLALLVAAESRRLYPTVDARKALLIVLSRLANVETVIALDDPTMIATDGDGQLMLIGSADGSVRVWNGSTGESHELPGLHDGLVVSGDISPDGRLMATGGETGVVRVFQTETFEPHWSDPLTHHRLAVEGLQFTGDGRALVSAGLDGVRLWDFANGQIQQQGSTAFGIAVSADGRSTAVGGAAFVEIRGVFDQERVGARLDMVGQVRHVAFWPGSNQRLIAADDTDVIVAWDAILREETRIGTHPGISGLDVHVDTNRLVTAGDDVVKVWSLPPGRGTPALSKEFGIENAVDVRFFSSNRLAVQVGDGVEVLSLDEQPLYEELGDDLSPTWSLDIEDGGAWAATGHRSGEVGLWDVAAGEPIRFETDGVHDGTVAAVAFAPAGDMLATGDESGSIALWAIGDGGTVALVSVNDAGSVVRDMDFDGDGKHLVTGHRNTIRVWRVSADGLTEVAGSPQQDRAQVWSVAFDPQRRVVASANDDGRIRLWDVGNSVEEIAVNQDFAETRVEALDFAPDRGLLASAGRDGFIRLWTWDGEQLRLDQERDLEARAGAVAFSSDGELIAVGSGSEVVLLDLRLSRLASLSGHDATVVGIGFRPGFEFLTVAAGGGEVLRWDLRVERLIDRVCRIANRNMTLSEWGRFDLLEVGNEAYVRHCSALPAGAGAPEPAPAAVYPPDLAGQ